jgi:hypothetical protein
MRNRVKCTRAVRDNCALDDGRRTIERRATNLGVDEVLPYINLPPVFEFSDFGIGCYRLRRQPLIHAQRVTERIFSRAKKPAGLKNTNMIHKIKNLQF